MSKSRNSYTLYAWISIPQNPLTYLPPLRYKIGDAFFAIPLPEAQSMLLSSTSETESDITKLEDELNGVREEMEGLKAHLYARFGRGINLEA